MNKSSQSGGKQQSSTMRAICCAGVLIAMVAITAGNANSQATATESQIKAAYIFNFAKFIEWPAELFAKAESPMNFCTLGGGETASELDSMVSGKSINGRAIKVRHIGKPQEIKDCHLVFVSAGNWKPQQLLQETKGHPILIIGEAPGFARSGGMIGFVVENGRVLFEVNPSLAEESHLKISSKLLALARIVSPGAERAGQ